MSQQDAPTVQDWLVHQDANTLHVLNRSRKLVLMNQRLKDRWAHEPWIDQIRIANIRGTTLVVFSQSAAALVPLRYKKQALFELVQQELNVLCAELEAKVVPNH